MEYQSIISLEQVLAGINLLFKELSELKNLMHENFTNQPDKTSTLPEYLTRQDIANRLHN